MEGYSRDLLCGIGRGDGARREQKPRLDLETEEAEVELSLGLSLGGRFGLDRRGDKLAWSSSVASILTPEEVALAPPALARTSSLPAKPEAEVGKKQRLDDWSGCRENGVEVEPAAKLSGSGSPSSGSSDGEGQRLEVNIADTLLRTSSLPAGIEDEWRKRKEAQSLKRLEVKRKRIERRNSLTSNVSKEATGQILEEMNARAEKVESSDDGDMGNKQIGGNLNRSNDKHHSNGLPPTHQAKFTAQASSLSGMPRIQNSAAKGTPNTEEHSPSPAVQPPTEGTNGTIIATPSSSALAVRAAALGSRGEQQRISGRLAVRAKSTGDVERIMMQEMPCVCTKGLPNGKRVEGFLYKYRKGEEVRIVCVCHGTFLTPAEFVKHAGGGDVANPLRHIVAAAMRVHAVVLLAAAACAAAAAAGGELPEFREAPAFRNGAGCAGAPTIHIAMTLDATYLRGSLAGVLSVLRHAACPESIAFHFVASSANPARRLAELRRALAAAFPTLPATVHRFDAHLVRGKISASVRRALDQPLNYARIYLADLLPGPVSRILYLDSDLLVVDDVARLWATDLGPDAALAAPEYCHANFTSYFTDAFWSHPEYSSIFANRARAPCYFNTGVMVIDLDRWRAGGYTVKLEYWMEVQKQEARIYELGSLPPFLLVFAGEVKAVEHRWNQHGLGGDNVAGQCRELHPGPVSLLHWSGKGKPWLRLDAGRPCPLDALWAPYDLLRRRGARDDLLAAIA